MCPIAQSFATTCLRAGCLGCSLSLVSIGPRWAPRDIGIRADIKGCPSLVHLEISAYVRTSPSQGNGTAYPNGMTIRTSRYLEIVGVVQTYPYELGGGGKLLCPRDKGSRSYGFVCAIPDPSESTTRVEPMGVIPLALLCAGWHTREMGLNHGYRRADCCNWRVDRDCLRLHGYGRQVKRIRGPVPI